MSPLSEIVLWLGIRIKLSLVSQSRNTRHNAMEDKKLIRLLKLWCRNNPIDIVVEGTRLVAIISDVRRYDHEAPHNFWMHIKINSKAKYDTNGQLAIGTQVHNHLSRFCFPIFDIRESKTHQIYYRVVQ